jgi:NAD(P)H-nitrite reductase large subunit
MSGDPFRRPRLVVVGNGMAGMRAVEELISRAPDRFDITVIGAEPHPNYSRILLSAVLAGEREDVRGHCPQFARLVRAAWDLLDCRQARHGD